MSAPTFRQSLNTVNARLGKTLYTPAARRSNANAAVLRGGRVLSSVKPTCGPRSLWTLSGASSARLTARNIGVSTQGAGSIRWKSGGEQRWRQWGFEDINAALPADSKGSPSKNPENIILVDVREPAELVSTGIIPTAVAVPLASQPDAFFLEPDEFETRFDYAKPGAGENDTRDMVFYCKAGVRARAAADLAIQAGYDPARIGVYDGSWLDWEKNGGRVAKWDHDE